METSEYGQVLPMPKQRGSRNRMSALEHLRAYRGMQEAMALGNSTLAALGRVRAAVHATIGRVTARPDSTRSATTQAEMRGW